MLRRLHAPVASPSSAAAAGRSTSSSKSPGVTATAANATTPVRLGHSRAQIAQLRCLVEASSRQASDAGGDGGDGGDPDFLGSMIRTFVEATASVQQIMFLVSNSDLQDHRLALSAFNALLGKGLRIWQRPSLTDLESKDTSRGVEFVKSGGIPWVVRVLGAHGDAHKPIAVRGLNIVLALVHNRYDRNTAVLATGTRVTARWKTGGRHYPGQVVRQLADGTCDIRFDDGDIRDATPLADIDATAGGGTTSPARVEHAKAFAAAGGLSRLVQLMERYADEDPAFAGKACLLVSKICSHPNLGDVRARIARDGRIVPLVLATLSRHAEQGGRDSATCVSHACYAVWNMACCSNGLANAQLVVASPGGLDIIRSAMRVHGGASADAARACMGALRNVGNKCHRFAAGDVDLVAGLLNTHRRHKSLAAIGVSLLGSLHRQLGAATCCEALLRHDGIELVAGLLAACPGDETVKSHCARLTQSLQARVEEERQQLSGSSGGAQEGEAISNAVIDLTSSAGQSPPAPAAAPAPAPAPAPIRRGRSMFLDNSDSDNDDDDTDEVRRRRRIRQMRQMSRPMPAAA